MLDFDIDWKSLADFPNIKEVRENGKTFAENARIDYTSVTLPGNRKILYNSGVITLDVNNTPYELLDGVSDFVMKIIKPATPGEDLNADTSNDEVQAIEVSFKVGEIGKPFSARIFPRNMVQAPS